MAADPVRSNLRGLRSNPGPTFGLSQATENKGPVQPVQPVQPFCEARARARARSRAIGVPGDLGIVENRLDRLDRLDQTNQINGLFRSNLCWSSLARSDRLDRTPTPQPRGSFPRPLPPAALREPGFLLVAGSKSGATISVQRNALRNDPGPRSTPTTYGGEGRQSVHPCTAIRAVRVPGSHRTTGENPGSLRAAGRRGAGKDPLSAIPSTSSVYAPSRPRPARRSNVRS